jgi:hypothetical protein
MPYVVVDKHTRCRHTVVHRQRDSYATLPAARAAVSRSISKGVLSNYSYEIMTVADYNQQVPMREVTNLMSGKQVLERADTPRSCSVASETYWSS